MLYWKITFPMQNVRDNRWRYFGYCHKINHWNYFQHWLAKAGSKRCLLHHSSRCHCSAGSWSCSQMILTACICTGSRQIRPRKISSNKITKICFDSFQWRISNDWGSRRMFPSLFPFIGLSSILGVTERKYYPFRNHLWKIFQSKIPTSSLPSLFAMNFDWFLASQML